jgi:hypothetical protein
MPRWAFSSARERILQRIRQMKTYKLVLAASMMVLVAISGQALASTAKPHRWTEASRASHAAMVMPLAVSINTHPYHGGPKVND